MRKTITFLSFAAFALTMAAQTVNIEGDPHGGNPYANITAAITDAIDGDVILISGVHSEAVTFSKSITLRGTDPTTDIIQAVASLPAPDGSTGRVISIGTGAFTITIENLGIRFGNDMENGGGINADKVTGLLTLKNLIIEQNYSVKNGGGLGLAGSNVDIIDCTIQNNSSTLDGGGIIIAANNGSGANNIININQSLINSNIGRNGGGLYLNGNNGFGNDYLVDINIENSTISNNTTTSAGSGLGGGAIYSVGAAYTSNTAIGNITLKLIHATVYNNSHASLAKSGLQFGTTKATNFSAYNSIIVCADDLTRKALNFANTNTTEVKNCILGGLENPNTAFLDDASRNNVRGYTATNAGLTGSLASNGGSTQTIAITESSKADDYCTAATGISIPTIDQRGYNREGVNDAGAFEFGGTLSVDDLTSKESAVKVYPNPAQHTLYVKSLNTIERVAFYDITGKLVLQSEKIYNNSIDVSKLNIGIYMVRLEDENKNSSTKKLIIAR